MKSVSTGASVVGIVGGATIVSDRGADSGATLGGGFGITLGGGDGRGLGGGSGSSSTGRKMEGKILGRQF